jgi:hypothetical protein
MGEKNQKTKKRGEREKRASNVRRGVRFHNGEREGERP